MSGPTSRVTSSGQVLFVLEDGRELESVSELHETLLGSALSETEKREALRCPSCGHDCYADPHGERPCKYGRCVELFCRNCGHSNMGWGPVNCQCQRDQHRTWICNRDLARVLRRRDRRAMRRNRRPSTRR